MTKATLRVLLTVVAALYGTGCGPIAAAVVLATASRDSGTAPITSNSAAPWLTAADVAGRDGDITVWLTVGNESGERVQVLAEFSLNDGTWLPVTDPAAGSAQRTFPGSPAGVSQALTWRSKNEPQVGEAGFAKARLRLKATDTQGLESPFVPTAPFVLGNDAPSLSSASTAGTGGNVVIRFTVADTTSDPVDVTIELEAPGVSRRPIALSAGNLQGLTSSPSGIPHDVTWASDASGQLQGQNVGSVRLFLSPKDSDAGAVTVLDVPGTISNNHPPTVNVDTPPGVQTGNVPVSYALQDDEGDEASVLVEYSLNGGPFATAASVHSGVVLKADGGSTSTILDAEAATRSRGFWRNRVVEILSGPNAGRQAIVASYTVAFPAPLLTLDRTLPAPVAGGDEYLARYPSGGTDLLATSAAGTRHRFVWDSRKDVKATDGTVRMRITPRDASGAGVPVTTGTFDLNDGPFLLGFASEGTTSSLRTAALADTDGDGLGDIIWIAESGGGIGVMRQTGPGAFGPSLATGLSAGANDLRGAARADFDGDGKQEVVLSDGRLFRETAPGVFALAPAATTTIPATATTPPGTLAPVAVLAVGDVDAANGALPEVVSVAGTAVRVSRANGLPAFATSLVASLPFSAASVDVGDVAGDGACDIVVAGSTDVLVLRNAGGGVFVADASFSVAGGGITQARLGDVDGDGDLDAVLARAGVGLDRLEVWRRQAGPPVTFVGPDQVIPVSSGPFRFAVLDVNGDRVADLVNLLDPRAAEAGFPPDRLSTLEVRLGPLPYQVQATTRGTGDNPRDLFVGDADADGLPDVLVTNREGSVAVHYQANALLRQPFQVQVGARPLHVAAGDVASDDGLDDLGVAPFDAAALSVVVQERDGSFAVGLLEAPVTGPLPRAVAIGDLTGDGRPDLAYGTQAGAASVFQVLEAGGGTSFSVFFTSSALPNRVFDLEVGDLNGDGRLDVVVATESETSAWLSTGAGFAKDTRTFPWSLDVHLADLDGDGDLDLVVAGGGVYRNDTAPGSAAIAFSASLLPGIGGTTATSVNGRVDGLGRQLRDVVTGSAGKLTYWAQSSSWVFDNLGDVQGLSGPGAEMSLAAADVNGDGTEDVVASYGYLTRSAFDVFLRPGGGGPMGTVSYRLLLPRLARGLVTGDWNGDGRPDFAAGLETNSAVAVLLSR